jgi:hypothetical protein
MSNCLKISSNCLQIFLKKIRKMTDGSKPRVPCAGPEPPVRGHHPLSLVSPFSLRSHAGCNNSSQQARRGAPCPERASHIGQRSRRETRESDPTARKSHVHAAETTGCCLANPFCFCLPLNSTVSFSTIENSCPTTFDFELRH